MQFRVILIWTFVCAISSQSVVAQQPPAQPAPAQAQQPPPVGQAGQPAAQQNNAIILAVTGNVQWRPAPDGDWRKAEVGATVPEGGAFRTGLRSAVQARIGSGQVFTIDRLGIVTLEQMINAAGTDQTRIGIENGRILFNITATEFANDVQIRAPDATLAVRGTFGGLEVAIGFATLAYGLLGNDGQFTVEFIRGREGLPGAMQQISAKRKSSDLAKLSKTDRSSSKFPDPAAFQNVLVMIDTGDFHSRESDEAKAMRRAPGGSTFLLTPSGVLGHPNPIVTAVPFDLDADGKFDLTVVFINGIETFQFTFPP